MAVSLTLGPIIASSVPSLNSCAFILTRKISEFKIAEFNSTVQVSKMSDPTISRGLATSLVSVIEDGGTI